MAVSIIAGASVFAVLVYLALRLYRKTTETGRRDAEKRGLSPPSIVLTSSSPEQGTKRLYAPVAGVSKDNDERLAKMRKKEKRKETKSLWLPKRNTSLPTIKATLVQPTAVEHSKVCSGTTTMAILFQMFFSFFFVG